MKKGRQGVSSPRSEDLQPAALPKFVLTCLAPVRSSQTRRSGFLAFHQTTITFISAPSSCRETPGS
jgi:hypothetical protein